MRYRPINGEPQDSRLGRFIPDDWQHVDRYPITALAAGERPRQTPVVIGVNWYAEFDNPEQDEKSHDYIIAPGGARTLTKIRGGHCVCLEPGGEPDEEAWWNFYDQGSEGACVGFGWSRCMTILNKGQQYTAWWLWDRAKEIDQWSDTNPGDSQGTSVRAAAEILGKSGHVDWKPAYAKDDHLARAKYRADVTDGIRKVYRWATSVTQVHDALANPRADALGAVPILNSWGKDGYPHRVWLPDDVLERLIQEDGEIAIPTDR
jgi:hypothetical protein